MFSLVTALQLLQNKVRTVNVFYLIQDPGEKFPTHSLHIHLVVFVSHFKKYIIFCQNVSKSFCDSKHYAYFLHVLEF